jgi:hypothetical protein
MVREVMKRSAAMPYWCARRPTSGRNRCSQFNSVRAAIGLGGSSFVLGAGSPLHRSSWCWQCSLRYEGSSVPFHAADLTLVSAF